MKIMKRIVCVKLKDDIQNPGEMNGEVHVKARYRLSDLIRAQKNDKMTSNLSQWIRTGSKEKGDLEEDSYKILSQFYKERKDLLYHTADGVVACNRKDEEKISDRSVIQITRSNGAPRDRQSATENTSQV